MPPPEGGAGATPRQGEDGRRPPDPHERLGESSEIGRGSKVPQVELKSQRAEGRGKPNRPSGATEGSPTTSGERACPESCGLSACSVARVTFGRAVELGKPTANPRGGEPKARDT